MKTKTYRGEGHSRAKAETRRSTRSECPPTRSQKGPERVFLQTARPCDSWGLDSQTPREGSDSSSCLKHSIAPLL